LRHEYSIEHPVAWALSGRGLVRETLYGRIEESGLAKSRGKSLIQYALCPASTSWSQELPDENHSQGGLLVANALGAALDDLGRQTGVIRRQRKFTGASLFNTMGLTLLKFLAPRSTPSSPPPPLWACP
jgi:hypothetical protein